MKQSQRTIPRESLIAWLAGIIDGEGTIGCYFYHDKSSRSPRYGIWIVNTDQRIILEGKRIFELMGIEKIYIGEKNYKGGIGRKRSWYLQINRKADIQRGLEIIIPYLISKKKQAQLILSFFKSYPNLLLNRGNRSGKKNDNFKVYSKLIEALKKAKMEIGEPVETKR